MRDLTKTKKEIFLHKVQHLLKLSLRHIEQVLLFLVDREGIFTKHTGEILHIS